MVEDVESPLPLSTPLLLVKPPVGLSTPAVFKALDLGARSTADPQHLLSGGPRLLLSSPGSLMHCLLCVVAALDVSVHSASETQQVIFVRCQEECGLPHLGSHMSLRPSKLIGN